MKTKTMDASQKKEAVSRVTTTIEKIRLLRSLLNSAIGECEALRQELTCISNIPIEYIDPYPGNPFYVENDEDIRGMYGKANDIRISF